MWWEIVTVRLARTGRPGRCRCKRRQGTAGPFETEDEDLSARTPSGIARQGIEDVLAAAREVGQDEDAVARALFSCLIAHYRSYRSLEDIRHELEYALENLDPDEDYAFMRP